MRSIQTPQMSEPAKPTWYFGNSFSNKNLGFRFLGFACLNGFLISCYILTNKIRFWKNHFEVFKSKGGIIHCEPRNIVPRGRVLFPRAKCVVLVKVVGQVLRVLFLACVLGRFRGECGKFLRGLVKGSKKRCKQRKLNQISRRSGFCTVISKRALSPEAGISTPGRSRTSMLAFWM